MTNSESPPIACTLGSGDFKDRIGWIRELSAKSLRSHRRDGLMLELTYDASAAADVQRRPRRDDQPVGDALGAARAAGGLHGQFCFLDV